MDRGGWLPLFLVCLTWFGTVVTTGQAQECELTFYMTGTQQNRVVFTGLTAEEGARSDNTTTGHRLTCACPTIEGLTPLQWLDESGMVLPNNRARWLVDYKEAGNQPGSAVHFRINQDGFSCAEAGVYTCVIGTNTRTVLVTPIGQNCSLLPSTLTQFPSSSVPQATNIITSIPDVASSTPVVTHSTPVIASTSSDVASRTSVITHSTPVIASSPSDVAPRTSVITHSTPVIVSSPSDVAPSTPVITHSTSVITSTSSVADSTSAVVTPSSTTASTRPSTSPTPSPTVDPQMPTDVSVSTPRVTDDAVQVTLMWSKPGNDSGLTGYQIQISWESKWDPRRFVKRQSEHKTMSVNVTDTSYTLQDAEGFAEYCFGVSALYKGGEESPATDEECTTTPETKPSPPLNLRQVDSSVTTSSVRLQWDAPDPPNGNITHFKVYYQQGPPRQYQVSDWHRQGYVVLDGLDSNTEYYVNVTAVTDTFESDTSNGLRVMTLPVATLPDRGVGMSSDSGEVIWTIVTALLLLVFTNAVSVVVTFLCTRRCYRKRTSSPGLPSPEEKCDHYETVELDDVQMQICPAYASVDEAKSS